MTAAIICVVLPRALPGYTSCRSVRPCCSGVRRPKPAVAIGLATGTSTMRPLSFAVSSALINSRIAIVARNSSPCVLMMMPNVGPVSRPVMTCRGIVRSAPFSIVVTGSRSKVRPSFSVAQRGPVAALISPLRKSLRLFDQLEIHEHALHLVVVLLHFAHGLAAALERDLPQVLLHVLAPFVGARKFAEYLFPISGLRRVQAARAHHAAPARVFGIDALLLPRRRV